MLEVSQLWRATVTEIAQQYPDVTLEHQYVDACAMHLMNTPRNFDVVLTENLFGDILSRRSPPSSPDRWACCPRPPLEDQVNLYEPVHGSAPDIAGKGIANPLGAILTAAMLLRHSANLEQDAQAVETAVRKVLEQGYRTADLARTEQDKKMTLHAGDGQTGAPDAERNDRQAAGDARGLDASSARKCARASACTQMIRQR